MFRNSKHIHKRKEKRLISNLVNMFCSKIMINMVLLSYNLSLQRISTCINSPDHTVIGKGYIFDAKFYK